MDNKLSLKLSKLSTKWYFYLEVIDTYLDHFALMPRFLDYRNFASIKMMERVAVDMILNALAFCSKVQSIKFAVLFVTLITRGSFMNNA